ncbi:MAG TPA: AAA family ATPase [Thermoanaerobaculia bacterium]|nr:AAA family ATPase [Thermoanaerobaculia bacterium]
MITDLTLSGYRSFSRLRVDRLTRVNLFVGTNNAGKTSILEAVELVATGTVEGLVRSAIRRGERILSSPEDKNEFARHVIDPSHLFHGHALQKGASFSIEGQGEMGYWVRCDIEFAGSAEGPILSLRFLSHLTNEGPVERLSISPSGGVLPPPRYRAEASPRVNFLDIEATHAARLSQLWDSVVLTPEEERVATALQIIEPRLERIAFVGENGKVSRSIFLKLASSNQRLPLGSLGDGLKRLLALALHLVSARGGFLLVDEIDTGLHHTVMADMWRLVIRTAIDLKMQVFATTHSLDCVRALAWVCEEHPEFASEATLHRIEKGAPQTVAFSIDEVAVAAQHHLEVR